MAGSSAVEGCSLRVAACWPPGAAPNAQRGAGEPMHVLRAVGV
jgi:hypothetical protein